MPSSFDWLAIYGASLASVTFGWQVFRELWANRVRLRVSCSQGLEPNGGLPARAIVLITVTNLSHLSVQAAEAGLSTAPGIGTHIPHIPSSAMLSSLPKTIEPGHSITLMWYSRQLAADRRMSDLEQFGWTYVRDGRGKLHTNRLFKHFWEEFSRNLERQEGFTIPTS